MNKILDVNESYLVMELAAHGSLADQRQLPVREAKDIFVQVFSALTYVHACGYMHLDIKSENILIFSKWPHPAIAKLSDFGQATDEPYTVFGTYLAPEMCNRLRGGERRTYTKSVDIWSFGILILYHSLYTGFPEHFMYNNMDEHFEWSQQMPPKVFASRPGWQSLTDIGTDMAKPHSADRLNVKACLKRLKELDLPIVSTSKQERVNLLFLQSHDFCPRRRAIAAYIRADPQAQPSMTIEGCNLLDAFSLSLSDKSVIRQFEELAKECGSTSNISLADAADFLRNVSHPTRGAQIDVLRRLIDFVHLYG